jgi:hypothetical protein
MLRSLGTGRPKSVIDKWRREPPEALREGRYVPHTTTATDARTRATPRKVNDQYRSGPARGTALA